MKNTLKKMVALALTFGLATPALAAPAIQYVAPVYKEVGGITSPTNGIKEWVTLSTNVYTVVGSSASAVTWGTAGATSWYVVTNGTFQIDGGVQCAGNINLVLCDGAKLTVTNVTTERAGIQTDASGSFTVYGQPDGAGELSATGGNYGAGIGGGDNAVGSNITINGGCVTAVGGWGSSGIGGGYNGAGSNITVNAGTVTATGGEYGAGIGGGKFGICSNITINGGAVTATGGSSGAGIGNGTLCKLSASGITISADLTVKADASTTPPTTVISDGIKTDFTSDLAGKRYIKVETPEPPDYLTFTSKGAFQVQLKRGNSAPAVNLECSTDKTHWSAYDPTKAYEAAQAGGAGDYVLYWRGTNNTSFAASSSSAKANSFTITTNGTDLVACSGNVETLLDYKVVAAGGHPQMGNYAFFQLFYKCDGVVPIIQLPATNLAQSCYQRMFCGCTSLTAAPELPATNLAQGCYYGLFQGCTSLTAAPKLSATTLAQNCYYGLFQDCTSLTNAPTLPATDLADSCYVSMFSNCKSLMTAPALPATNLAAYCYNSMFSGCTSLTNAPALSATTLADSCYQFMFQGCTSLTTAPELSATNLMNRCYMYMFSGCTSLTAAPELPATNLANYCYRSMFQGCSSLVVNGEAPGKTWSIPSEAAASAGAASYWNDSMFANAGGNVSAPTPGVTYYIRSAVSVIEPSAVTGASKVTVSNGTAVVAGPPYTVYQGDAVKVTYTADAGYEFPGGATTWTTNFTASAATVTVTIPEDQKPTLILDPSVMIGKPAQRYPWNGIVDVPFQVRNLKPDEAQTAKFTVTVQGKVYDGGTTNVSAAAGGTVTGTFAIDFKALNLPTDRGEATVKAGIVAE